MTPINFPQLALRLFIVAVLALSAACSKEVGSECETDQECPTGAICDNTVRDGYCTIPDCERGDCPEGSVCVKFDRDTTACMKYCELDDECREGYQCRADLGTPNFCYVAP